MTLVRNQIRNMPGGQTGKITFGRINYTSGLGAKEFRFVNNVLVQYNVLVGAGLQGYRY